MNSNVTFTEVYKSSEQKCISVELVADEDDDEGDEVFHIIIVTPFGISSTRKMITCAIHDQ